MRLRHSGLMLPDSGAEMGPLTFVGRSYDTLAEWYKCWGTYPTTQVQVQVCKMAGHTTLRLSGKCSYPTTQVQVQV